MRRATLVLGVIILAGCGAQSTTTTTTTTGSTGSTTASTTSSSSTGGTATGGTDTTTTTTGGIATAGSSSSTTGGTSSSSTTTGGTGTGSTSSGAAACPAQNNVSIASSTFTPSCITISLSANPVLSVTNNETNTHHRVKCNSPAIDMGDQAPSTTATTTLTATGDYAVYCQYHSLMHLTVHVTQ